MASRTFEYTLKCGCLVSSDAGGCLMPCYSDNCDFINWLKTKEGKKHLKECQERNG
jgi:hypothetical protein